MAPSKSAPLEDGTLVIPTPRFTIPWASIEDDMVLQAISLRRQFEAVADVSTPGRRRTDRARVRRPPETFPVRALLVAMVVCALTNEAMLATDSPTCFSGGSRRQCATPSGSRRCPALARPLLGQLLPQRTDPVPRTH